MKILVIGGTGLIGANVAEKLITKGHEVIIGSPSRGINIITGEGLSESLKGTDVVIDLSNSSSPEEENALNFFKTAGKNLVEAEQVAGVKHHLVLSIVGIDHVQYIGYLRAKKKQEDIIKNSGIPYTIIRSTQFHEHLSTIIAVQGEDDNVYVSTLDFQPIAAEDVARYVVQLALEKAKNDTIEIAGPELAPMDEFVSRYIDFTGQSKKVISDNDNKYMFFDFPKSVLVPEGTYKKGEIYFDDWAQN
ncbi:SDR family oxidoreductase [Flavobacterium ustbae]|uniref:SDR family oxidoreductase n=1 Tax=Flavobacterium ustbae TaxID=2488790 RepID=UPI000F78AF15|nr:SDR family oxidoreductase [Flavobacterium ustbae]